MGVPRAEDGNIALNRRNRSRCLRGEFSSCAWFGECGHEGSQQALQPARAYEDCAITTSGIETWQDTLLKLYEPRVSATCIGPAVAVIAFA